MHDLLPGFDTYHWTGTPQRLTGQLLVDGTAYVFMGNEPGEVMTQTKLEMDLFSTVYTFETDAIRLTVRFTAPQLPGKPEILCRPLNYLHLAVESRDGKEHDCAVRLTVCDEICLDKRFDAPTIFRTGTAGQVVFGTLENAVQEPLCRSGDDIRIQWGRFYLATNARGADFSVIRERRVCEESQTAVMTAPIRDELLAALAYDDFQSLMYFGSPVEGYWKKFDHTMESLLEKAFAQYGEILALCRKESDEICQKAEEVGGEYYKELLILAWRQSMAAHKAAMTEDGELLYISKECFSDGDAATVDVTYPSSPLFLLYNPELLRGMLLPIFTLAESDSWVWDCAPHDVGVYPILNGQEYKDKDGNLLHMPVEECGNMIILTCAYMKASGNHGYAGRYLPLLRQWVRYLVENGEDPENQLCTDDFAGKSPHNCNLTLKAIMGVACYGLICGMLEDEQTQSEYLAKAKQMAQSWQRRAVNDDGSYRRAFDLPGSYSLKYNMVWDKVFGTELFTQACYDNELASYLPKANTYGVPLDERATYTKSDWIVWCAAMTGDRQTFEALVKPVWQAYNDMSTRYPMGDWYDSVTGQLHRYPDLYTRRIISFQNRSVQAGLVMPLLVESGKLKG